MNLLESIPQELADQQPWVEKGGVHWLESKSLNVRDLARAMNAFKARFVTITAYQLPAEQGMRLEYHWDLEGQLLAVNFTGRDYEPLLLREGDKLGVNLRQEAK